MDPVTQATVGAAFAQSGARAAKARDAALIGAAAGLAPDLDGLIRSADDPLLLLELHRHFTHALAFIPVGALLCATLLHPLVRRRLRPRDTYLFCVLGYGSHGLLDACTSYGTMLLLPFSDARIAWNIIAAVDPLFTLPVFALVVASWRTRRAALALGAIAWGVSYLLLGHLQMQRAEGAAERLAMSRGHAPVRLEAKPSLLNIVLWKTLYEHDGVYHVDAVHALFDTRVIEGESTASLDLDVHFPWLDPRSQQARDVERFRRVSDDFLTVDDDAPNRIVDMRYSMLPNEIEGFWAIELDPDAPADRHVGYVTTRENARERAVDFLRMLFTPPR